MGKIEDIKELLKKGIDENEILKKGYAKGSITRARNQLENNEKIKENKEVKDEMITLKLKEFLNIIDIEYDYIITIRKEKRKKSTNNEYMIYQEIGKDAYIDKIKFLDKKGLLDIGRNLECKNLGGKDKLELIEIICDKIEKGLTIGRAFRK